MPECKEGCGRVARSPGMCSSHYRRWLAGLPLARHPDSGLGAIRGRPGRERGDVPCRKDFLAPYPGPGAIRSLVPDLRSAGTVAQSAPDLGAGSARRGSGGDVGVGQTHRALHAPRVRAADLDRDASADPSAGVVERAGA
jgi:hypothetical protein